MDESFDLIYKDIQKSDYSERSYFFMFFIPSVDRRNKTDLRRKVLKAY